MHFKTGGGLVKSTLKIIFFFTVLGPVSDNEVDDSNRDKRPSPPTLGNAVPEGVLKPVPQRVTGRRAHVESILDLIQEEESEQTEPVDLSVKRPRYD